MENEYIDSTNTQFLQKEEIDALIDVADDFFEGKKRKMTNEEFTKRYENIQKSIKDCSNKELADLALEIAEEDVDCNLSSYKVSIEFDSIPDSEFKNVLMDIVMRYKKKTIVEEY